VQAQEHEVSGQVLDADDGEPLPGVNVVVQGSSVGTTTNAEGNYSLEAPSPDATLRFSFVGYETQEIPIQGRTTINVQMEVSSEMLDEVVVVGYGTQNQAEITGSVSSVSAADLENDVSSTIDQALQGRTSGAMVIRNSGRPGGDVSIRIRGLSTLNTGSDEPLYIVDGVPLNGDSEDAITNPLASLNPQDIESIDILKDASAAAIYGSRASNGVVLITTKRGEAGQQRVDYSASVGMEQLPKKMDVMDLQQYARFVTRRAEIVGYNNQPELTNPDVLGQGSDWQDALFRSAYTTDHSLAVSGGSEDTQYRISGGYTYQQGVAIESNFERYSLRVNVDNQTTEWLEVGTSLNLSRTHEDISVSEDDLITTAIRQRPNVPVRTPEGGYGGPDQSNFQLNNPVGLARLNTNEVMRSRAVGEVFANIDILENLKLNNEVNGTVSYDNNYVFEPTWEFGARSNDQASSSRSTGQNTYWQIRNYLNYNTSIEDLQIDAMVGHEVQMSTWDGLSGARQTFPSNAVRELSAGDAGTATNSSYAGSHSMESAFSRLNLSYDNRYLITGNFRADASSNFSPENRWGYFPSVSGAWRVTNEPFLEGTSILEVVDQFKLRVGYGFVGNQDIGGYRYGDTFTIIPTDFGNGIRASNLGNPGVQWESTESLNLGLDVSVFDERASLSVDAYQKRVEDLLLEVPLPLYSGTSGTGSINNPLDNIGVMENQGLELSLNTVNLDGGFRWTSNVVFTLNRNEVVAMNDDDDFLDRSIGFFDTASRTVVGEPAAQFYGYVVEGIFQNEEELRNHALPEGNSINETQGTWVGDLKFKDLNGDGDINEQDRTFIGNPTPDFTYGVTNRFNYKGVDLSVFVNGSYGNDIFNQVRRETEDPSADQGMLEEVFNYARIEQIDPDGPDDVSNLQVANPGTDIPRITDSDPNGNQRVSSRFVEDGSYLRIQNVTLGYTLPSELATQLQLRQLRVYGTVQNVYTFTAYSGYDPEVGAVMSSAARDQGLASDPLLRGIDVGRYPTPRTFTIGVNVGL
jgi:TonB-linked SusC/RagA family outer membrane protein